MMNKRIVIGILIAILAAVLFIYFAAVKEEFPVRLNIAGLTPDTTTQILEDCGEDVDCFKGALSNNCQQVSFMLPYPSLLENETRSLIGRIEGPEGGRCKVSISDPQSGGSMVCSLDERLMKFINSLDGLKNYCKGSLLNQLLGFTE